MVYFLHNIQYTAWGYLLSVGEPSMGLSNGGSNHENRIEQEASPRSPTDKARRTVTAAQAAPSATKARNRHAICSGDIPSLCPRGVLTFAQEIEQDIYVEGEGKGTSSNDYSSSSYDSYGGGSNGGKRKGKSYESYGSGLGSGGGYRDPSGSYGSYGGFYGKGKDSYGS